MRAGRWGIQVNILDRAALVLGLADEVDEVAGGTLALALDLDGVLALVGEVLDAPFEADAEVFGGKA